MNCLICKERIERNNANKIDCMDCKNYFHCKCVNLKLADVEYFKANNKKYRCDKCSVMRRKTLQKVTTIPTQLAGGCSQKSSAVATAVLQNNSLEQRSVEQLEVQCKAANIAVQEREQQKSTSGDVSESIVTLQLLYEEILSLKQMNFDFLASIQQLKEENKALKVKVANLESKLNWKEQKQLENTIEIIGVPNANHENAKQCVGKIFSDALNVVVSEDEIEDFSIKRINVKGRSAESNIRHNICVKLKSYDSKKKIMAAKRTAKQKLNTSLFSDAEVKNIYINNCFTNYNLALFLAAKKVKQENHFKYLWFNYSRLLMKKTENDRAVVIKTFDDLAAIPS